MKSSKLPFKILSCVLALLILAYVGYHIVMFVKGDIETELAEKYAYDEKITTDCLFIRNEKIIDGNNSSKILAFCQKPGSKVAANSVVAQAFSDEKSASDKTQMLKLQSEIDNLKSLQASGTQLFASAEKIDMKIEKLINDYTKTAENGGLNGFKDVKDSLCGEFNKRQIATGAVVDFNSQINNLQSQISALEGSIGSCSDIYAPDAGYFVDKTDGFESKIDYEKVNELKVEDFNSLLNADVESQTNLGKICTSNEWYLAVCVDQEDKKYFTEGKTHEIIIPGVYSEKLECDVYSIKEDASLKKVLVIFICDQLNYELASARKGTAEIVVKSYDGIKINSDAVRVVDGVKGVYVNVKNRAYFKTIEVIYSDSNFTICEYDSTDPTSKLQIYDEVVVTGVDLYNDKPLN